MYKSLALQEWFLKLDIFDIEFDFLGKISWLLGS